ncbi:MAG: dihydroneopterin aldolase [Caulobacterales bacterium]|nr:dihydroneopterin aldolase [Caulobacterales bacterium]
MTVASLPDEAPTPAAPLRVVGAKIFVRGLKVDAEIGVYAHEYGRRQPLVIDVELDAAVAGAERLADTLNYETVANAARDLAENGHWQLVETFAERLAEAMFADPRVSRARVRIEKPLALAPVAEAAGVEIVVVRA